MRASRLQAADTAASTTTNDGDVFLPAGVGGCIIAAV